MSRALDDYLEWLTPQVRPGGLPHHQDLLHILMEKEFVWLVPNDDNRVQDALDLRTEYFDGLRVDTRSLGPVSVLEVIVGLSRRVAFMASTDPAEEAWGIIKNLDLDKKRDPLGRTRRDQIDECLDVVIWRKYAPDGSGGFFPLAWPDRNQKEAELWVQLCAYVEEKFEH